MKLDTRLPIGVTVLLALTLAGPARPSARAAQFRPPLDERIVPAEDGTPIRADLPLADDATLEALLFRVTDGLLPVAIERVATAASPSSTSHARTVVLSGQRLPVVLDLLTHERDGIFHWSYDGNIVRVTSMGSRRTFLDTVIPAFGLAHVTLEPALARLRRQLDPGYPLETSVEIDATGLSAKARTAQEDVLHRPITASLTHVTVRDVLDALVGGVGDSSWAVHYASADGKYEGSEIVFHVYGGLTIHSRARR